MSLLGFYLLIKSNKNELFYIGFFIALLWFYWIGFSFKYYDLGFLAPFITLFIALAYGVIFWICGVFNSLCIRALLLFSVSFIAPFGFNWLDFRLLLLNTPFKASFFSLFLIFLSTVLMLKIKKWWRFLTPVLLLFALNFDNIKSDETFLDIKIVSSFIDQSKKWNHKFLNEQVELVFNEIQKGIDEGKDLILFPESALPLFLNLNDSLMDALKAHSNHISIVIGSLYKSDEGAYNTAYHFENGEVTYAHKVILVPFGERVPLPKFLTDLINRYFFFGASDFLTSSTPTDFLIKGKKARSAICFEATKSELFEGNPSFMLAMSNNAWFTPSTQPVLQKRVLKLYATLHKTTIYHSVNGAKGGVITPTSSLFY